MTKGVQITKDALQLINTVTEGIELLTPLLVLVFAVQYVALHKLT